MNYAMFKTFLATFLWKQNDTDLIANLDNLIKMADAELNRILDIQRRDITLVVTPTTQDFLLPPNFRHIVSVNNMARISEGAFKRTNALDIYRRRQQTQSLAVDSVYSIAESLAGKLLLLVGPFTVANPGNLVVVYRSNVPDYFATNSSWLATDFLDLYVYTVLGHTAPFLREDERLALWDKYKTDAIGTAIQEDRHGVSFGGSPLHMQPAHAIPSEGRRR